MLRLGAYVRFLSAQNLQEAEFLYPPAMCKTSCLSNLDETSPGQSQPFCHVAPHCENAPCHSDFYDLSRSNVSAPTIYEIGGRSPRIQTTSEVQTQLNSQRYLKGRICDVLSQVREERATPPTAPSTRSRLLQPAHPRPDNSCKTPRINVLKINCKGI